MQEVGGSNPPFPTTFGEALNLNATENRNRRKVASNSGFETPKRFDEASSRAEMEQCEALRAKPR